MLITPQFQFVVCFPGARSISGVLCKTAVDQVIDLCRTLLGHFQVPHAAPSRLLMTHHFPHDDSEAVHVHLQEGHLERNTYAAYKGLKPQCADPCAMVYLDSAPQGLGVSSCSLQFLSTSRKVITKCLICAFDTRRLKAQCRLWHVCLPCC